MRCQLWNSQSISWQNEVASTECRGSYILTDAVYGLSHSVQINARVLPP